METVDDADWAIDPARVKLRMLELNDMKQDKLGELTGVSQGMISKYLKGSTPLKKRSLQEKFARALRTNSAWLCAKSSDPSPAYPIDEAPLKDNVESAMEALTRIISKRHADSVITKAEAKLIEDAVTHDFQYFKPGGTPEDVVDGLITAVKALGTKVPRSALWTWSATGKLDSSQRDRSEKQTDALNADLKRRAEETQNSNDDGLIPDPPKKPKHR